MHYDFEVGHVNLASYLNEMKMKLFVSRDVFLVDQHHSNTMGPRCHCLLAFRPNTRQETSKTKQWRKQLSGEKTTFDWACGRETEDKRFVQSLVTPLQGA